jgi:hypothetical protein
MLKKLRRFKLSLAGMIILSWISFGVAADLPDLAVGNLQFTPPNPKPGDTATFSFTIRNVGNLATPQPTNAIIYSLPQPFTVNGDTIPVLAPGASKNYTYSAVLNNQSPGTYLVGVDINLPSKFAEGNVGSNYQTINVTVSSGSSQLPDLAIVNFTLGATEFFQGANPTLTLEIKNIGNSPAGATTAVFSGHSGALNAFGLNAPKPVPPLAPNQSYLITVQPVGNALNLPVRSDGYGYAIDVRVNPNGASFDELTLTNNGKSVTFKMIAKPKIIIDKYKEVQPLKPGPPDPGPLKTPRVQPGPQQAPAVR